MVPKNIIVVLGKGLGLFESFYLFSKEEGADYMSVGELEKIKTQEIIYAKTR